jgi:hypothetical protein
MGDEEIVRAFFGTDEVPSVDWQSGVQGKKFIR